MPAARPHERPYSSERQELLSTTSVRSVPPVVARAKVGDSRLSQVSANRRGAAEVNFTGAACSRGLERSEFTKGE